MLIVNGSTGGRHGYSVDMDIPSTWTFHRHGHSVDMDIPSQVSCHCRLWLFCFVLVLLYRRVSSVKRRETGATFCGLSLV